MVPELASREHLRNLMPVARQALGQANVTRSNSMPWRPLLTACPARCWLACGRRRGWPLLKPFVGFTITRRIFIHRGLVAIAFATVGIF